MEDAASAPLGERARDVLRSLIQEHVRTGKPVGSRRVARLSKEGLSAATIRNVMADLEEEDYLAQPHTSAGRVPTARGYRLYVDFLLEDRVLSDREVNQIQHSLEQKRDPDELMNETSQLLSVYTDNVGFVLAPAISSSAIRHIKFVKLSQRRTLLILVTKAGLVQHRFVRLGKEYHQSELDQASRFLVEHFEGRTLMEIRDELLNLMSEEKALYDRRLKTAVLLGSVGLMDTDDKTSESEVYWGGAARVIRKPELSNLNRRTALFETFEEKSRLVRIITECVQEDASRPTVVIGLEKYIPAMRDWALVTSPYQYNQRVVGSLGVLGPVRMEYERTISLVTAVAQLFGRLLNRN